MKRSNNFFMYIYELKNELDMSNEMVEKNKYLKTQLTNGMYDSEFSNA